MAKKGGAPENLDPVRTKEEAKKRGRNGGVRSGEARRKKRTMKEAAKLLMDMPTSFQSVSDSMKAMGIDDDDLTNQMAIVVSMYKEAMSGNVRAAEFIRDTLGDGAEGQNRAERLAMDRERLDMEKERFRIEREAASETGDGMPTIINVRPDRSSQTCRSEEEVVREDE